MLTASLTNIITEANSETTPSLIGKSVGVLKGRMYDAQLVTKNGGILEEVETEEVETEEVDSTSFIKVSLKYFVSYKKKFVTDPTHFVPD